MIARTAVNIIVSVHNLATVVDTLMARSKVARLYVKQQTTEQVVSAVALDVMSPWSYKSFDELYLFFFITYFGKKIPTKKKNFLQSACVDNLEFTGLPVQATC